MLNPLATLVDVQARMFRPIADAETTRVELMLADSSAVVRNYCHTTFAQQRETQRLRPIGHRVRLPHKPVQAVHAVTLLIHNQSVPVAGYVWDGLDEVWLSDAGQVINLPEVAYEWLATRTPVADVDYTSGYADVPSDVVGVVCSMVTRALSAPGAGGIISEGVGEYTYRLSDAAAQGPLTLTDAEKTVLAAYRRAGTQVELRW